MNIRDEIVQGINSESKTIFYKFKNKKLKFIIKPINPSQFFNEAMIYEVQKEMSNGQNQENAVKNVAEKFRGNFLSSGKDSIMKTMFSKFVEYPKIVDKEKDLKDNEVPYSLLNLNLKIFLLKNILNLSGELNG